MRIEEIKAVFPAADQRKLTDSFRDMKVEDYSLVPLSDPKIEGDGDQAHVPCKRSILEIPKDRTAFQRSPQTTNAKTDMVEVRLTRSGRTWKIVEILTK
jgi:hypothetical protein